MKHVLLALTFAGVLQATLPAQAPVPPIADTRLTVHTLLREDIFAGFLQDDEGRLARAEQNIESMLASRRGDRASLIAWQGSTALTRAVLANAAKQPEQFSRQYARARSLFAEAGRLEPDSIGVLAITGGTFLSVSDRLPPAEQAAGWQQAYAAYQRLWALQGATLDRLPLHMKGEVLSGLAQTAQRTGRHDEIPTQLDRMLTLLPDTVYARRAQQWKDDPAARAQTKIACQTCHAPGTLAARITEVSR
jgi:hypothetical protein